MIKGLIIAITFLTRIPIKINFTYGEEEMGKTALYFPIVGLIIGMIVAGCAYIVSFVNVELGAVIGILTGIVLTGGLHLDGAMDTADGIFSARSRERILEIMKDSRVGAHGVTAAIILLLLKYSSYKVVLADPADILAIPTAFILSRWVMVFGILYFPGARPEGLGRIFIKYRRRADFLIATLLTLLPILIFARWDMVLPLIFTAAFSWLVYRYLVNILGGLTGDTYGALAELSEVIFIVAYIISRYAVSLV